MALLDAMKQDARRHYPGLSRRRRRRPPDGHGARRRRCSRSRRSSCSAQAGEMVGVDKEERLATPWPRSLRFRHPWLQLNLLTAFIAAAVVGVLRGHDRPDRDPRGVPAGARRAVRQHRLPGARGHAARHDARRAAARRRRRALVAKEALLGLLNGALVGVTAGARHVRLRVVRRATRRRCTLAVVIVPRDDRSAASSAASPARSCR